MKKKGITFWEQHLEHIVLGAAVLFLLGFGGWQLTRSPNVVNGVAPDEADPQLEDAVESLTARLDAEPIDLPSYRPSADRFVSRFDRSVSPVERLAVAAPPVDLGDGTQGDGGGERLYVTLDLPAPDNVGVRTDYDALLPQTIEQNPELRELLVSSSMDLEWNTISARLDLAALEAEFRQPGDDDRAQIPENWYGGRVSVIDVRVERQQRTADGWSESELVSVLPGSVSLRPLVDEPTEAAREQAFAALEDPRTRREVVQPEFLPTLNSVWVAPDPLASEDDEEAVAGLSEEELEIRRLLERLTRDRVERARLLERLLEAGGTDPAERAGEEEEQPERPGRERQPERGGGGGIGFGGAGGEGGGRRRGGGQRGAPGMPGGGGGGGGDDEAAREERDAERRERLIQRLESQIIRLDDRIERWEQQLTDLGVDLEASGDADQEEIADPFSGDELAVWAFDVGVEPGATYRYRVAVDVYNPFFRRRIDLSEEQYDLAESMVVSTRASEWSDPVEVLPPTSFYVTEAYPESGTLGLGTLRAEVYRFQQGRWWKESFLLQPGDVIGEERRIRGAGPDAPDAIDFGTGWYVLDVLQALEAEGDAREEGLAAEVIVQRVDNGELVRVARPRETRVDRRRLDLDRMVDEADAQAALEQATGE